MTPGPARLVAERAWWVQVWLVSGAIHTAWAPSKSEALALVARWRREQVREFDIERRFRRRAYCPAGHALDESKPMRCEPCGGHRMWHCEPCGEMFGVPPPCGEIIYTRVWHSG